MRYWTSLLTAALWAVLWTGVSTPVQAQPVAPCITHYFVSAKPDPADQTLIKPSDWNECHVVANGAIGAAAIDQTDNFSFTGTLLQTTTVAGLGTATSGVFKVVTDGNPDCSTGGGSTVALCRGNGSTWNTIGGGTAAGDITSVWSGTAGDVSALTAAAGDSLNAASADSSIPVTKSTSLPGTCTQGQFHMDTDDTGSRTFVCATTNTWVRLVSPTDNVATASALNNNPVNCSAGNAARGIDNVGAAEDCFNAMEEPVASGLVARTAANTATARTITGDAQVSVTNGDGVAGNPTLGIQANSIGSAQINETDNYLFTGTIVTTTVVGSLGTPTNGVFKVVTDANTNCSTGGGSAVRLCRGNGSAWDTIGDGTGSSTGDIEAVWACLTGDCSALTASTGDTFDAGSANASSPATRSTSLPGSCTEGQFHQDTDSGGSEVYVCTATNTWSKLLVSTDNIATATSLAANGTNCSAGSGAGGTSAAGAAEDCTNYMEEPGANGIVVRTAANTSTNRTIAGSTQINVADGDGVAGNPTLSIVNNTIGAAQIDETDNYVFTGTVVTTTTVASLGTATAGVFKTVTDANPDCATGGGTTVRLCRGNGATWDTIGDGTAAGTGDIEAVWGCTTGDCSALTGAAGDSLDAGSADSISPATRSTSLPGTCTEGQFHQDTDSGGTELYVCTATNTWTKTVAATDNVATASALAANGGNCSAGSGAGGTNSAGVAEDCTDYMEEPGGNGIVARTAANTVANRTITGTGNNISVTNGDGVSGNPTINVGTNVVLEDQANTWTTGAQDMGAATSFKVPTSAGAAPTASGLVAYDSTSDRLEVGVNTVNKSLAYVEGDNTWTGTQNFSSATLTIPANSIGAAEIDETASYVWTGTQDFSGATLTLPGNSVGANEIDETEDYTWTGQHIFSKTIGSPNGSGAPAAGSCTASGFGYVDNSASEPYFCTGVGANPLKFSDLGSAFVQFLSGDDSVTATGADTMRFATASSLGREYDNFQITTVFTNQPANDGVEFVSDNAGDTTQTVQICGTTNGADTSKLLCETVTLNGTTQVSTAKTDWGAILTAKKSAATTGTVTIREASGNATITTMGPSVLRAAHQNVAMVNRGFTSTSYLQLDFAGCVGATAGLLWDDDATGATAPTAACNDTGTLQRPSADFSGSAVNAVVRTITLPPDWTGNIDLTIRYVSVAASPTGNVEWDIQTACRAAGETWDGSFNAAQTITDAVAAQNVLNDATQSTVTVTGCAAGEDMQLKVSRDGTNDTNNDLAKALWARLTLRRLQANE